MSFVKEYLKDFCNYIVSIAPFSVNRNSPAGFTSTGLSPGFMVCLSSKLTILPLIAQELSIYKATKTAIPSFLPSVIGSGTRMN